MTSNLAPLPPPPPPPLPVAGLLPPGPLPIIHAPVMAPPLSHRNPFTSTVLLTNVPPFLHTFRAVRDWLYPCGGVRNCLFYPRKEGGDENDGDSQPPPLELKLSSEEARISILVTMFHPDGACKLLGAFKQFVSRLDDRYSNTLQAYMVPANKDVPLPPPQLDEESQQLLGEKLWKNFVAAQAPGLQDTTTTGGVSKDETAPQPLDADKVAAAAGGNNYDAEEDPLNAPAVLEAVKEFRRKLSKTQSHQKRKRMELVAQKLALIRPRVQAMMEEEKRRPPVLVPPPPPPPLPPAAALLPPPSGLSLPPPPLGGIAIPVTAADSGKRKYSNLPAWMTNQPPPPLPAAATDDNADQEGPASKRAKPSEDYPSHFPTNLPPLVHEELKQFLGQKVREALGEEEPELIQFVHSHVLSGKSTAELLQELQMVLEEEAGAFLQAVWQKVRQIVQ